MWYGFYGDALSSASGFDGRMDALSREIGVRGRADAVVAVASNSQAAALAIGGDAEDSSLLAAELRGMKVSALRKRAVSAGVSETELDEADDAADTKAEIVKMILACEVAAAVGSDAARDELLASKTSLLRKKAIAAGVTHEDMEAADDSDDAKAALVELLLAAKAGRGAS
jgi:hypothetical protein